MRIKILAVEDNHVKEGKKDYHLLDVSYKNLEFNKVEGKKLVSFASPDVYNTLKSAQPGDEFDVTKGDKTAAGHVPWVRIAAAVAGVPAEDRSTGAPASSGTAGKGTQQSTPRSTYETPEERSRKQVYIVRQSSITAALSYLNNKAKSVDDVVSVAKQFEAYVFGIDAHFEEMDDDIPL